MVCDLTDCIVAFLHVTAFLHNLSYSFQRLDKNKLHRRRCKRGVFAPEVEKAKRMKVLPGIEPGSPECS
jgi:hypothetical protein